MPGTTRRNTAILRWLPAVAWMAVIFFLSSQPDLPGPASHWLNFVLKKSAHFFSYALLAILFRRALYGRPGSDLTALILTLLYAISDEFHQSFVPGRSPRATDVLIDLAGALTALAGLRLRDRAIGERARSSRDRPDPGGGASSA